MIGFIKASLREFNHVVWPTRKETKKYFIIVVTILVTFWLYLFIVSTIFSKSFFYIKNLFNWTTSIENTSTELDLDSINFDDNSIIISSWIVEDNSEIIDNSTIESVDLPEELTQTWEVSE